MSNENPDDFLDPTQKYLKQLEKAIQVRLGQITDQVMTLARNLDQERIITASEQQISIANEQRVNIQTLILGFQSRHVFLLAEETKCLTDYLAAKDPELKRILENPTHEKQRTFF